MDPERLFAVKEEMEKAEARKLQPYFVRAFFQQAFQSLEGELRPRENGRYEINHVPAAIRERDRQITGRDRRPLHLVRSAPHDELRRRPRHPVLALGNNDLWNLVPVDPNVNANKSDKLPAASLVQARRASILRGWQVLRAAVPGAFDQQAGHLLGRPLGGPLKWEDELFARLREAIEITALQRGVERWTPGGRQPAVREGAG